MAADHPPVDSNGVDAAIDRVLDAEARARDEINHCRGEALTILRQARSRARGVSQRTDRRIGQVHLISDTALKARLDAIAEKSRALSDPPRLTAELEIRLEQAIERLITEILE